MKKVEIMKRAIADYIADGNMTSNKWTAKADGLHWSYMDVRFPLTIEDHKAGTRVHMESDEGVSVTTFSVPAEDWWLCNGYHDFCRTPEEALYWATRAMIAKAEALY